MRPQYKFLWKTVSAFGVFKDAWELLPSPIRGAVKAMLYSLVPAVPLGVVAKATGFIESYWFIGLVAIAIILGSGLLGGLTTRNQGSKVVTDPPTRETESATNGQWLCKKCGLRPGVQKKCMSWAMPSHGFTWYSGDVICEHCGTRAPIEGVTRCPGWTYHRFVDSPTRG